MSTLIESKYTITTNFYLCLVNATKPVSIKNDEPVKATSDILEIKQMNQLL